MLVIDSADVRHGESNLWPGIMVSAATAEEGV